LNHDELVEVYEIWKLLGPMAAARAARLASREHVLEAVDLVARMRTENEGPRWAEYNYQFHGLIEDMGSGPRMAAILGELRVLTKEIVEGAIQSHMGGSWDANADHEEILRAIMSGDAQAAADATLRHLDSSLGLLLTMRPV
jgi:DNA-binding GntR family transcriptional regulator